MLTMSIIATYRAATLVVAAAIIKVTIAKQRGMVMWKKRSPVLSACHEFASVVMTARMYGGVVKSSVTTSLY